MSSRMFEKIEAQSREFREQNLFRQLPFDYWEWKKMSKEQSLDALPVGVAILDSELLLDGANQIYAGYLNQYSPISPSDAVGKCYFDYLPGSYDWVGQVFRDAKLTGKVQITYNKEVRVKWDADNVTTFWDATLQPLLDKAGRVRGLGLFCLDLTAKTVLSRRLQSMEKNYASINELLHDARSTIGVLTRMEAREKAKAEETLAHNINELILPLIKKLKGTSQSKEQQDLVCLLENTLANIVSDFSFKLTSPALGLTRRELMIASLIKEGLSTNQIAGRLNLSKATVEFHRHNLRKKLCITNKKVNLRTFLTSM